MDDQATYNLIMDRRYAWSRSLINDGFAQGKGSLVRKAGNVLEYCCLGVAYAVLGKDLANPFQMREETQDSFCDAKFLNWPEDEEDDEQFSSDHFAESTLNPAMAEFLGLAQWEISILINLNDSNVSFHVIAGVIDELPVYINEKIAFPERLAVHVEGE